MAFAHPIEQVFADVEMIDLMNDCTTPWIPKSRYEPSVVRTQTVLQAQKIETAYYLCVSAPSNSPSVECLG